MIGKKKKFPVRSFWLLVFSLLLIGLFAMQVILGSKIGLPIRKKILPPITHGIFIAPKGSYVGISLHDENFADVLSIEKSLDVHFAIVGIYLAWGQKQNIFDTEWADSVESDGSIPLVTWEPWIPVSGYDRSESAINQKDYRLSLISQGKYDKYIHKYAQEVADFRKPIILRFAHEMNGNWYPWGSTLNQPSDYVAAWRHVHNIFLSEGASNVLWLWSPNEIYSDENVPYADKIAAFYPGDTYVDLVGFSSFNWAGRYKQNVWRTPQDLFLPTIAALRNFHKPIIIAETASADSDNLSLKAQWIQQLANFMQEEKDVLAVIWFDVIDNGINWKIDSSKTSSQSFSSSFGKSYFIKEY